MSKPDQREALAAMVREVITGESLRDAVLNTDGDADWDWASRWLADYLAQELDGKVVVVAEVAG